MQDKIKLVIESHFDLKDEIPSIKDIYVKFLLVELNEDIELDEFKAIASPLLLEMLRSELRSEKGDLFEFVENKDLRLFCLLKLVQEEVSRSYRNYDSDLFEDQVEAYDNLYNTHILITHETKEEDSRIVKISDFLKFSDQSDWEVEHIDSSYFSDDIKEQEEDVKIGFKDFLEKFKDNNYRGFELKDSDIPEFEDYVLENELEEKVLNSYMFHDSTKIVDSYINKIDRNGIIRYFSDHDTYLASRVRDLHMSTIDKMISKLLVGDLGVARKFLRLDTITVAQSKKAFNRLKRSQSLRFDDVFECPIYSFEEKVNLVKEFEFKCDRVFETVKTTKELKLVLASFEESEFSDWTIQEGINKFNFNLAAIKRHFPKYKAPDHLISKFQGKEIQSYFFQKLDLSEKSSNFVLWYLLDRDGLKDSIPELISDSKNLSIDFISNLILFIKAPEKRQLLLDKLEEQVSLEDLIKHHLDLYSENEKIRLASKALKSLSPGKFKKISGLIVSYLSDEQKAKIYGKQVNTIDGAFEILAIGLNDTKLRNKAVKKLADSKNTSLRDLFKYLSEEELDIYLLNNKCDHERFSEDMILKYLNIFSVYINRSNSTLLENIDKLEEAIKWEIIDNIKEVKNFAHKNLCEISTSKFYNTNHKKIKEIVGKEIFTKFLETEARLGSSPKGMDRRLIDPVSAGVLKIVETDDITSVKISRVHRSSVFAKLPLLLVDNDKLTYLVKSNHELITNEMPPGRIRYLIQEINKKEIYSLFPKPFIDVVLDDYKTVEFEREMIVEVLNDNSLWSHASNDYDFDGFLAYFNLEDEFNNQIASGNIDYKKVDSDCLKSHFEHAFLNQNRGLCEVALNEHWGASAAIKLIHSQDDLDFVMGFSLSRSNQFNIFETFHGKLNVDQMFVNSYEYFCEQSRGSYDKSDSFLIKYHDLAIKNFNNIVQLANNKSKAELRRVIIALLTVDSNRKSEMILQLVNSNLAEYIPKELSKDLSQDELISLVVSENFQVIQPCLSFMTDDSKTKVLPVIARLVSDGKLFKPDEFYVDNHAFAKELITLKPDCIKFTSTEGVIYGFINIYFRDVFKYDIYSQEFTEMIEGTQELLMDLIAPYLELHNVNGFVDFKEGVFTYQDKEVSILRKDLKLYPQDNEDENVHDLLLALLNFKVNKKFPATLNVGADNSRMGLKLYVNLEDAIDQNHALERRQDLVNKTRKELSELQTDFDRLLGNLDTTSPFGIEIEYSSEITRDALAEGINEVIGEDKLIAHSGYFHSDGSNWDVKYDCSVEGKYSAEIVSPKLYGEDGIKELENVLNAVDVFNGKKKVIDSNQKYDCGIHVHHEAKDIISHEEQESIKKTLFRLQGPLYSLCHKGRSDSGYCGKIMARKDGLDLGNRDGFNFTRYGTLEFRMKEGSMDKSAILRWVRLTQSIVNHLRTEIKESFKNSRDSLNEFGDILDAMSLEKVIQVKNRSQDDYVGIGEFVDLLQITDLYKKAA